MTVSRRRSLMRQLLSRLYIPSSEAVPPDGAAKAPRPSITFLVVLNGLVFFSLGAVGNHTLGILLHVPTTIVFMLFSALPQLLVRRFTERKRCLKPIPRTLAYLSPLLLLLLAGALLPRGPQKPNHLNPAPSPDGRYEARFSSPSPGWNIVVVDTKSGQKWKEETSFMPHLQIYWRWDANNRLWIYNSDDAGVHFLDPRPDGWALRKWGWGHRAEPDMGSFTPPSELYPEYDRAAP